MQSISGNTGDGILAHDLKLGRCLVARLGHGADILGQIADLAKNEKIETGTFSAIGALMQAELAYYDQSSQEYRKIAVEGALELVSCSGNVSTRDGQPSVHAHAALADLSGNVKGGHLLSGKIFAAELCLQELLGKPLVRKHDQTTGLYLWDEP